MSVRNLPANQSVNTFICTIKAGASPLTLVDWSWPALVYLNNMAGRTMVTRQWLKKQYHPHTYCIQSVILRLVEIQLGQVCISHTYYEAWWLIVTYIQQGWSNVWPVAVQTNVTHPKEGKIQTIWSCFPPVARYVHAERKELSPWNWIRCDTASYSSSWLLNPLHIQVMSIFIKFYWPKEWLCWSIALTSLIGSERKLY